LQESWENANIHAGSEVIRGIPDNDARLSAPRLRSFHLRFAAACSLSGRGGGTGAPSELTKLSKETGMAMVDLTRLTRSAALALFAALSRLTSFAAFAGLTLFAALVWPMAADAGTAIHFTLDRKIDGPAAPFFLTIDKGYFKAEGLNVTIDASTGGPLEAIDRLATGAYDMGVADINLLIKFRDSNPGTPIKALYRLRQLLRQRLVKNDCDQPKRPRSCGG